MDHHWLFLTTNYNIWFLDLLPHGRIAAAAGLGLGLAGLLPHDGLGDFRAELKVRMHVCMHACMYVCMHVCTCVYVYLSLYVYTYIYI